MNDMRWRLVAGEAAHAEVLAAVHAQCFDERWSAAVIAELLSVPRSFALVAVTDSADGDVPAGFTLVRLAGDDAELLTLCTLGAYRRRGVASALLDAALLYARDLGARRAFLEVAETNEPARVLYASRGFTAGRRRPDYYRAPNRIPVAALELCCDLTRSAGSAAPVL
jgi:ribosomal-protein-alanine N-acetyltransferase